MPRALRPVLLWVGATLLAVTVTVSGVQLVLRRTAPDPTGDTVTRSLGGAPGAVDTTPIDVTTGGAHGGVAGVPAAGRPSPTPAPRRPTGTWVTTWHDSTGRPGVQVDTPQGQALVTMRPGSPATVDVVSTRPVRGATADVEQVTGDHAIVTFRAGTRRTKIDIRWQDGQAKVVVTRSE